jgi:hypothetical protein
MWHSMLKLRQFASARNRPQSPRRRSSRLTLEILEDRTVPSTFNAATVSELIGDINAANLAGGSNTIVLAANTRFVLTAPDNTTNGPNGLPVIAANDNLTIIGQGGDIISPMGADGYFYGYFRCFDVSGGAALRLSNLTLSDFQPLAEGFGGGAIYNQGTLVLDGVNVQHNSTYWSGGAIWSSGTVTLENGTLIQNNEVNGLGTDAAGGGIWSSGTLTLQSGTVVQGNTAAGSDGSGGSGFGGGIWSSGTLTLEGGTVVQGNLAAGGAGANSGVNGGNGYGGGLYVAGGTVNLQGGTLVQNNQARGGAGGNSFSSTPGNGGNGFGGGIYVAGGTVNLSNVTLSHNGAQFGAGGSSASFTPPPNGKHRPSPGKPGNPGNGSGGALYAAGGTITLLNDTVEFNNASDAGGGLYIVGGNKPNALVCLDAFTVANVINNTAARYSDIFGSYQTC